MPHKRWCIVICQHVASLLTGLLAVANLTHGTIHRMSCSCAEKRKTSNKMQLERNHSSVATVATAAVLVDGTACRWRGDPRRSLLHRSVSDDAFSKLLLSFRETGAGRPVEAMHLRTHRQTPTHLDNYCKTLNVRVPFISQILRAKQKCEIKGREYRYCTDVNWYSMLCWNCVVGICQNKRRQNNFACEVANFWGSQIKGFYSKQPITTATAFQHKADWLS